MTRASEIPPTILARLLTALLLVCASMSMVGEDLARKDAIITSLKGLQDAVAADGRAIVGFRVEGVICAIQKERGLVALQDESTTGLLELPLADANLRPGKWIAVEGTHCALTRSSFGIRVGTAPVAEMDGLHPPRGDSGRVYLSVGNQPLRVEWFNGVRGAELRLEYEGPDIARQPIPDSALMRKAVTAEGDFQHGLDYTAFIGDGWDGLPDFRKLQPMASGMVTNFDIERRTRPDGSGLVFSGFLQISNAGIYTFHLRSDDGGRIYVGDPLASVRIKILDRPAQVPSARSFAEAVAGRNDQQWVTVEGKVGFAAHRLGRMEFDLVTQGGTLPVTVMDDGTLARTNLVNCRVRATGVCQLGRAQASEPSRRLIVADAGQLEIVGEPTALSTNTVLTFAGQVRDLQPDMARKPMRARVRGVVTWASHWSCVLQDSSGGIFIWYSAKEWERQPRPEEIWEIEGVTDAGDFSPLLTATSGTCLGNAVLPEPVQPTWEQLMNGSMDAEQVELQGAILNVSSEEMTLLTRDGQVTILTKEFYPLPAAPTLENQGRSLSGRVVRIRGVMAVYWDRDTRRPTPGRFYIGNATLSLEDDELGDAFSTANLRIADLLKFTSHVGALTRVKVSGQVIHVEPRECFLMDDTFGFRASLNEPHTLQAGDVVEVAGFPQLGGPSPVLLEASVRKTGSRACARPVHLTAEDLSDRTHDATLIETEATLIGDSVQRGERVLELEAGQHRFLGRLQTKKPDEPSLRLGSRLRVAGVYSSTLHERAANSLDTFELLVNRPDDIAVLRQGPWWTTRHTIVAGGVLLAALTATLGWVTQLRRTVTRRTEQLRGEIEARQQIEQQRALDRERARVSQDLHDELGAGLAEVGILGALANNPDINREKQAGYLGRLAELARHLVTGLDEIVWAVNPKHDSHESLAGYLCDYALEFLQPTGIACRLDVAHEVPDRAIDARQRHQIFLAFKEGLTNVVKHSRATEVWVRIGGDENELWIEIQDDGRGLPPDGSRRNGDGLSNMATRLKQIGGECEIANRLQRGTAVRFRLFTNKETSSL